MLVMVRCDSSRRIEGLLLAMDETRVRIAVRRLNETLEFHRVNGFWFGDKGSAVEIESIVFPAAQPAVLKAAGA